MIFKKKRNRNKSTTNNNIEQFLDTLRSEVVDTSKNERTDMYFSTMNQMREAISKHEYKKAAKFARSNLQYIPDFLIYIKNDKLSFTSIPALEHGGTILALYDDDEGLEEMRKIVVKFPELNSWIDIVKHHQEDRFIFKTLMEVIYANPNCLQNNLKNLLGVSDGRRVSKLVSYLEKAKKIRRIKKGGTYEVIPYGKKVKLSQHTKKDVKSHRITRKPLKINELEISSLEYIPLPRSPLKWEVQKNDKKGKQLEKITEQFCVRDTDWEITSIEKIPMEERPDPAFRKIYPSKSGIWMIDDLGNAEGLGEIEAAALFYDRKENLSSKKALNHGIYRIGVHPQSDNLIAMSPDCVVHAYSIDINPLFETSLVSSPEIKALKKRFPIEKLKNVIRCVALSKDSDKYLVTAVDEAWCFSTNGEGQWGVKLPIQDGWSKVATPSNSIGSSIDIQDSLEILDLALPVSPDEIKHRYHELAKKWHPDLNPSDSEAEEKMKALNNATEILTGIDTSTLPHYTGIMYRNEFSSVNFETEGGVGTVSAYFVQSEMQAADWIYAAGFAVKSDSVFLAGYSGRVVNVDKDGKGIRVYDIGSVPRQIIETDEFLYLLTDTRLYVLKEENLHALIDTCNKGDLIMASSGFGLIEDKQVRWFNKDGSYLGRIVSKTPIRRVYTNNRELVIESRQYRSSIKGIPDFWI